ncbi:sensor domain-containing diguanylate cyclase [Noviherbaspirillum sp.]|uniref:sensor domain-containing diguanylate cyclase n=1 Tax=Noviherbaspirillum sp. TaxID=1926288 RepID=UPI002B48797D|nr:sensor domain-containing diguanylate cyclase [Noviherbaspirillum sp.]HJV82694.1 sensor domain-containing diguanylate cyclase [Noviherbaspirillum sp.]
MTRVDSAKHSDTSILRPEQADVLNGDVDQQMLRISRIGKTLFDVANCVIRFGDTPPVSSDGGRSIEAIETAFCYSMPLQDEPVVAPDTRSHSPLGQHRAVTGAPYIRFYASHPVYNGDKALVGSINLVDYAPRPAFRERDIQLLADLAALVERELHLRLINASQLDLQKKNKNLRRKSLIDPLIGTWNRGAIMRILTIEAVRCDKAGVPLSLIVADLDFFKKINDTYGHPAGDTVLVKVASRLRSCIRPQEALGRYGGEEFLIVLPGSSHATAMAVAERMRLAIVSQPEVIAGTALNLTISAGVASTDLFPTATTEELISRADMALYAAKDAGRNRVVKATPDLS